MTIEYDSTDIHPPAVQELSELWRYRDLLKLLVSNSIKTRYKRSTLGLIWTLLNPLLNTLVLTIAFSQLMRFEVKSYPIYLLTGLILWNFFSQTTLQAANTLVWGSGLLRRIYIPRTIFAISVMGNGLINFFLSLIPLVIIMLAIKHPLNPTIMLLPLPIFLTAVFTLGVALMVSTLAIFFTDIVDLYNLLLPAWFYLTPIVYPLTIVPPNIAAYMHWNPMNLLLEQFRLLIYFGQTPSLQSTLIVACIAFATLGIGWWVFTKRVDELAYRI